MQFVHYTCLSDSVPRYLSALLPLAILDLRIVAMDWVEYTSYELCDKFWMIFRFAGSIGHCSSDKGRRLAVVHAVSLVMYFAYGRISLSCTLSRLRPCQNISDPRSEDPFTLTDSCIVKLHLMIVYAAIRSDDQQRMAPTHDGLTTRTYPRRSMQHGTLFHPYSCIPSQTFAIPPIVYLESRQLLQRSCHQKARRFPKAQPRSAS